MNDERRSDRKLTSAYDRMLERIHELWEAAPGHESLEKFIDAAREKAVEVGEITREEANRIGDYVRRDIEDAASFLGGERTREFVDWLRFDISRIEDGLLELFTSVADRTKLELLQLQERARHADEYRSGEITSIGTLYCASCGQPLHFHRTSHIPPCPSCHGARFTRHRPDTETSR